MNSIIKSVGFNSSYSDDRVYELWEPSTTENDTPTDNLGEDMQRQQEENMHINTDFLTTFMNQLIIWNALDEKNPKLSLNVSLILLILNHVVFIFLLLTRYVYIARHRCN